MKFGNELVDFVFGLGPFDLLLSPSTTRIRTSPSGEGTGHLPGLGSFLT